MSRYSKYFLEHILWLEDDFCQYYLQDDSWGRKDILDAQSLIFFWSEEAEQWLAQCADYDHYATLWRLRCFLTDGVLEKYRVHRMNDRQVMRAAARQICRYSLQLVIHPKTGWAVQVDPDTAEPVQPIAVEGEPELAPLLAELRVHLDALVAEQQQKHHQYEAQLANMSPEQKALLYAQKTGGAVYDSTVGGVLDLVKAAPGALLQAARAFPGFYGGYLKLLWKAAQTPSKMAALTARGLYTGDYNPLKHEIDQIVTPVAQTCEQAAKYKSMLTVLLSDHETYNLLYDFAGRYYDATHPMELAEMGASAVADIVVTVLLAMVTAGVGAAANVAAKSGRLAKAAELLEKIAATIRRVGHRTKLIGKAEDAFKAGKTERRAAKAAREAREVQSEVSNAERARKIEKQAQKEYDAAKKIDGPKKTTEPEKVPKKTHKRDLKKEYAEIMDANDAPSIKKHLSKKGVKFSKKEKESIKEIFDLDETKEMFPNADFKKAKQRIDNMSDDFSSEEIQEVKKYLFDNDEWSDNDHNNATAWRNLQNGNITEVEETLLKHERVEIMLKKKLKDCGIEFNHDDAHFEANEIYDFAMKAQKTPDFPFVTP